MRSECCASSSPIENHWVGRFTANQEPDAFAMRPGSNAAGVQRNVRGVAILSWIRAEMGNYPTGLQNVRIAFRCSKIPPGGIGGLPTPYDRLGAAEGNPHVSNAFPWGLRTSALIHLTIAAPRNFRCIPSVIFLGQMENAPGSDPGSGRMMSSEL